MITPRAFVSYSWDDDSHKDWVANLAAALRGDGVDVTLDQWHAVPGDQLPAFMENKIRENDYVLIICTPDYRSKSDQRRGGVGYEGDIMTAEVHSKSNHRKFIPILARGTWEDSAPSWLKGKYHVDLSTPDRYKKNYSDLTRPRCLTRGQFPLRWGTRPSLSMRNRSLTRSLTSRLESDFVTSELSAKRPSAS